MGTKLNGAIVLAAKTGDRFFVHQRQCKVGGGIRVSEWTQYARTTATEKLLAQAEREWGPEIAVMIGDALKAKSYSWVKIDDTTYVLLVRLDVTGEEDFYNKVRFRPGTLRLLGIDSATLEQFVDRPEPESDADHRTYWWLSPRDELAATTVAKALRESAVAPEPAAAHT